MTMHCPKVTNKSCFDPGVTAGERIRNKINNMMDLKWNDVQVSCGRRLRGTQHQSENMQRELGCNYCGSQPYLCKMYPACKRRLQEPDWVQEEQWDTEAEGEGMDQEDYEGSRTFPSEKKECYLGAYARSSMTMSMSSFLDSEGISYTNNQAKCMSGVTCTLEHTATCV